jgi:hypothetical protein
VRVYMRPGIDRPEHRLIATIWLPISTVRSNATAENERARFKAFYCSFKQSIVVITVVGVARRPECACTCEQGIDRPERRRIATNWLPINSLISNAPASQLRGESGSGWTSSCRIASIAVRSVQAGDHSVFSTSKQISPVFNTGSSAGDGDTTNVHLEVNVGMANGRRKVNHGRPLRILLGHRNGELENAFCVQCWTRFV